MIPSIETIVDDLVAGKITPSQAVSWLYAHTEGAANERRDYFAAHTISPMLVQAYGQTPDILAKMAYAIADAMLAQRSKEP